MTKDPRDVNPDLVRQQREKNSMGDRKLAEKPGRAPKEGTEGDGVIWDDDQRQLAENQNALEPRQKERRTPPD
jgi:hypothetical protein